MTDLFEEHDSRIVRCYCCNNWVRMSAVETIKTGVRGDGELWCIGCIRDVDSYTLSLEQPELKDAVDLDFDDGDYND